MQKEELISLLSLLRQHHAELLDIRQKFAAALTVLQLSFPHFDEAYQKQLARVATRPRTVELEQDLALFDQAIQELKDGKIQIH